MSLVNFGKAIMMATRYLEYPRIEEIIQSHIEDLWDKYINAMNDPRYVEKDKG